jgi:hypothetical protein
VQYVFVLGLEIFIEKEQRNENEVILVEKICLHFTFSLDASREMESKLNFMLGILLMWLSI